MAGGPLLLLMVVTIIVMVVALRYVMKRNFTDVAAHLQDLNAEYSRRQDELKQRLEESERQYQEHVIRAKTEAERVVTEAHQEAQSTRAKLIEEAHGESERIVQQGLESRESLRKEIESQLEHRATERACELIQQALPAEFRQAIQEHWLEELFRNGWAGLNRLKVGEDIHEVRVVSAFPLTKVQREALRGRLKETFAREVTVTEETDERLVAGLVVTVGSLVLDGSLASKIQQNLKHVREAA
jgi:F0F1-type ATP synthase membrane subunit b/b'